ncbi:MAG: S9 family peptidase, partial [Alphaproteobacteria bacterium]|nr:S9 family peptidase [Alphaproteobacteria bacterium]
MPGTGIANPDKADSSGVQLHYPQARWLDLVEEQFGVAVADPYRWLENDVRQDNEVRDWVNAENAVTEAYLATLPGREILQKRMTALFDHDRYGTPRKAGTHYFYTYNSGLQNQSPLYVRDGLKGKQQLVLDPNGLSPDGATALAEWEPSPDGRYLLYAVQDGGTDWRILHIIDVESGQVLPDEIRWVKFSGLAWDGDSKGFFYSRFDAPADGKTFQSTNLNQKVYYHRLGTPQDSDRLIYATPGHPQMGHNAQVSDDGKWLLITSSQGTDERYELTLSDLSNPVRKPWKLVRGLNHDWRLIGNVGAQFYFLTDKGASRLRVVTLDAEHPRARPVEIVPERSETLVGGSMVGDKIILAYLHDAKTVAEMIHLDGTPAGDVPIPGIGTAAGFGGKGGDPETFFAFSGFTTPTTIYRFDTATGETSLFAQSKVDFDPANYVTQQIFYPSKDGTQVPMFLIRRADVAQSGKPA